MNKSRHLYPSGRSQMLTGPKIISVMSGKGGVGKTVVACNLAERISSLGYKVLLVDADYNFGNVHILTNTVVYHGLGLFASGQLSLKEALTKLTDRLDILAADPGGNSIDPYDAVTAATVMKRLRRESRGYDFIIIDHSSGKSATATVMACESDMSLLIVVPELTSIADCYGLYKHLVESKPDIAVGLLINRVISAEEADYIHEKFNALTERFLNRILSYLGHLPEDEIVKESISSQKLIASLSVDSVVAQSLTKIGQFLFQKVFSSTEAGQITSQRTINVNPAVADIRE